MKVLWFTFFQIAFYSTHAAFAAAPAPSEANMQKGLRIDMIQVPRDFIGVSAESQWNRGLWTLNDAKYVLKEFQKQKNPNRFKAQTTFLETSLNFSDNCFRKNWPHLGSTNPYPLFRDSQIIDPRPDMGFRGDLKKPLISRIQNQFFSNQDYFNNENDFVFLATGFILITTPGQYEFGVLSDDGFYFQLHLNNLDTWVLTDSDLMPLHPPLFFKKTVELSPGLYPFTLLSFEHLEASVIRLTWRKPQSDRHEIISTDSLRTMKPHAL